MHLPLLMARLTVEPYHSGVVSTVQHRRHMLAYTAPKWQNGLDLMRTHAHGKNEKVQADPIFVSGSLTTCNSMSCLPSS